MRNLYREYKKKIRESVVTKFVVAVAASEFTMYPHHCKHNDSLSLTYIVCMHSKIA